MRLNVCTAMTRTSMKTYAQWPIENHRREGNDMDRQTMRALLGPDPLQTVTVSRRHGAVVKITMPDFDDGEPVWYFYANDTFNASTRDLAAIKTSILDSDLARSSVIVQRAPDGTVVHLTVLEVTTWLYLHHLDELCGLPGLPTALREAIQQIREEPA